MLESNLPPPHRGDSPQTSRAKPTNYNYIRPRPATLSHPGAAQRGPIPADLHGLARRPSQAGAQPGGRGKEHMGARKREGQPGDAPPFPPKNKDLAEWVRGPASRRAGPQRGVEITPNAKFVVGLFARLVASARACVAAYFACLLGSIAFQFARLIVLASGCLGRGETLNPLCGDSAAVSLRLLVARCAVGLLRLQLGSRMSSPPHSRGCSPARLLTCSFHFLT